MSLRSFSTELVGSTPTHYVLIILIQEEISLSTFICVSRQRDSSCNILSYTLQDNNGNKVVYLPDTLKQLIKTNQIQVTNLKYTKDGRLLPHPSSAAKYMQKY